MRSIFFTVLYFLLALGAMASLSYKNGWGFSFIIIAGFLVMFAQAYTEHKDDMSRRNNE